MRRNAYDRMSAEVKCMGKRKIVRDALCVAGVQVLAIVGMLIVALLLFPVCILAGIDHPDSMAAAAGGAIASSAILIWRIKRRFPDSDGLFSLSGVLRRWGSVVLVFGGYLLRCLLYSLAGGSYSIALPTQTLAGHLLFPAAYSLMDALALDAFGAVYLLKKGHSERGAAAVFSLMALAYAALYVLLRLTGGFSLSGIMMMLIAGLECAVMTLLFIRTGSLWGRMLFTGISMLIWPDAQAYSPLLFAVDLLFALCLCVIIHQLDGAAQEKKTA